MPSTNRPLTAGSYDHLNDQYFSLGQEDTYYEKIKTLGDDLRTSILETLRDMAFDNEVFEISKNQQVARESIFRQVSIRTVVEQFRRIAQGGSRLESFAFSFALPQLDINDRHPVIDFKIRPQSSPPTNLHVLVGRNGVGKTTLIRNLVGALVSSNRDGETTGYVTGADKSPAPFVNVIMVAFSAFDPFEQIDFIDDRESSSSYFPPLEFSHVGLSDSDSNLMYSSAEAEDALSRQFVASLTKVVASGREARWLRAIDYIESDPIFKSYDVPFLLHDIDSNVQNSEKMVKRQLQDPASVVFKGMSSGHKIVLLTMTRLVEKVTEKTLVLFDEPESHLHPPLLSALLRALSDLLQERNGVAVVATHSPVVLQEAPRTCVCKLRRHGSVTSWDRPIIETFGENVGVLIHEVFGLEVEASGFHLELRKAVARLGNYKDVVAYFGDQLGGEARGLVRVLLAESAIGRPE